MDNEIPFNLAVLKVYHAQKNRIRPLVTEVGLSPGQPKILTYLAVRGNSRQKELAEFCDIDPATISKLLDPMIEAGLVVRTGVDGDRRAANIGLTPKGLELRRRISEKFEAVNAVSLRGFTPQERAAFRAYLRRMYENLTGSPLQF